MSAQNRVQPGVREGGQFAATRRSEPAISLTPTTPPGGAVTVDAYQAYSGRIQAEAELNSRVETRLMVAAVAHAVQQDHPGDDTLIVHDYGRGSDLEVVGSIGPHSQVHTRDDTPTLMAGGTRFELGCRLNSGWGLYHLEGGHGRMAEAIPTRERRSRNDPAVQVKTLPIAPIQLRPGYTDPVESVLADERDDNTLSREMHPAGMTVYGFTLDDAGEVDEVRLDTDWHSEPTEEQLTQARDHVQTVLNSLPENTRTGTRWYRDTGTGAPVFAPHIGTKER